LAYEKSENGEHGPRESDHGYTRGVDTFLIWLHDGVIPSIPF
jgi:hypothetical protein